MLGKKVMYIAVYLLVLAQNLFKELKMNRKTKRHTSMCAAEICRELEGKL